MTGGSGDEEERIMRLNAMALLLKAGEAKPTPIDPVEARKLLGQMDTYNTGQGAFNLLVPKSAVEAAGLDTAMWDKAQFRTTPHNGREHYDVDYHFAVIGLLPILEDRAGVKLPQAQELAKRFAASDRPVER